MHVSVVIPVFNGATRLADAVASARAQLGEDDEIIVVDDGSTDGTAALIESFGAAVIALRQVNAGNAAARNAGVKRARGALITFLDHDDIWPPGRQTAMMAAVRADATADIIVGRVDVSPPPGAADHAADARFATAHRPWQLGALMVRRDVFDRVGLFDETMLKANDADWFMRAREAGVVFRPIDAVALIYRLHDTNISRDVADSKSFLLQAFKGALDRRRSVS